MASSIYNEVMFVTYYVYKQNAGFEKVDQQSFERTTPRMSYEYAFTSFNPIAS